MPFALNQWRIQQGAHHETGRENEMNQQRSEVMDKARARRRRQNKTKSARKASRSRNSTDKPVGLTEKVMDLAQGAAAQVGAFVKTATEKVAGQTRDHCLEVGFPEASVRCFGTPIA